MNSLVLELQRECWDSKISVADVLRRALAIASKLKVESIQAWVRSELGGYTDLSSVPAYRVVRGNVMYKNPFHGWQPVLFSDDEYAARNSTVRFNQSIAELEALVNAGGESITVPLPTRVEQEFVRQMGVALQPVRVVSVQAVEGIIDRVRSAVLDWCLELERNEILGEGASFSADDRARAAASPIYNIGVMNQSQIQHASDQSTQTLNISSGFEPNDVQAIVAAITEHFTRFALPGTELTQVTAEIETIKLQLASPRPNLGILREGLKSLRTIFEGAGGDLLAAGVVHKITALLSSTLP